SRLNSTRLRPGLFLQAQRSSSPARRFRRVRCNWLLGVLLPSLYVETPPLLHAHRIERPVEFKLVRKRSSKAIQTRKECRVTHVHVVQLSHRTPPHSPAIEHEFHDGRLS